jgi:WD40 repeat protein
MFVFKPHPPFFPSATGFPALAAALLFVFAAQSGHAQGTHLWTQSRIDEFEKGTPQGVSVTSDGHLREGPGLTEVLTTPSTFVWSVAAGKNGETYLGTASPAAVLRVDKDGKPFTLFESKDVSVQAIRLEGEYLYAATLPSGKVYQLKADSTTKEDESTATVVFDMSKLDEDKPADNKSPEKTAEAKADEQKDTSAKPDGKSHYIWDMIFDAKGRLYIATGDPGAIYREGVQRSPAGKPAVFFKSDEAHIRCLAWDGKGNLLAGSDGSGLVYRIDSEGKGYVLFEAPRREITSLAVGSNGTIYAASVGDKSHNPLPPLPVQGQGSITITVVQQPGSLQAANTSVSVPEGSEIYELTPPDEARPQAPRRIWAGKDEIVYALSAQKDGLLALTGNRGHIFKIYDNGDYADIAHLDAQQGLSLASNADDAGTILIGTGNTGKLVRLGAIEKHEYASDVLDAGALARFGRIEVEPGSSGYALLTRSGNVEQPVRGWSDWQPLKDGASASPAGRFFEWKAVLQPGGTLGGVGVNYLPVNSAPVVEDLVVVTGARINPQTLAQNQPGGTPPTVNITLPSAGQSTITFDGTSSASLQALKDRTAITVRWATHDDNGDDLIYSLYLRGDGETVWRLLKDQITDKAYSFDATLIPDGGYQIKVVASDSPSHTPADALTGEKISERFEVDTTPPVVSGLKATVEMDCGKGHPCGPEPQVTFFAEDAFSPIAHAEYSLDAGPWQFIDPVGELSDSRQEHYDFHLPAKSVEDKPGEHLITVRVYDRHDNVGVAKAIFMVPAK